MLGGGGRVKDRKVLVGNSGKVLMDKGVGLEGIDYE